MTTRATRDGDAYILNGQKRFIVGAEGADYFLVYARTDPNAPGHRAISAFIVERDAGVEVQHVYGLMGTRGGGTGRVYFRDARVPLANLIGREHGAAEIFNQMMIPERMTTAAGAVGMARAALEIAARYADRRKAFGQKIREFEGVSFKVADSLTSSTRRGRWCMKRRGRLMQTANHLCCGGSFPSRKSLRPRRRGMW